MILSKTIKIKNDVVITTYRQISLMNALIIGTVETNILQLFP